MILSLPPAEDMDKNAVAELHRGDTVKPNGPPSYNSAVARSLVASRSASAPAEREKQLPIAPESSSSSSQAFLPPLSLPRQLSSPSPSLAAQAHPSPAPTSLSARPQSHFDASPSTAAPTPPFMRNSASQPHIAPRTVHSTSSIGSYVRNQRSTPSSPSQSSTDAEGMYSPDMVYLMDSHALTDAPIINGLHLVQKEPIVGSWRLDVDFPRVSKTPPKAKRPRRARKAMCEDPNLSFETKAGNIAAQFAIIGRASYESRKAFLRVTSRAGKVNIDIKEQTQGRYFDLDVYNKSGETIILIPRSFRGVIDLYSSQGRVVIRPALAGVARTLKSSKEEMLLLVGNASAEEREHMDFVRFNSEGGAPVVVGFTAEDDITVSAPGFWRKFGLMLQGKSTRAIEKSAIPEPI